MFGLGDVKSNYEIMKKYSENVVVLIEADHIQLICFYASAIKVHAKRIEIATT